MVEMNLQCLLMQTHSFPRMVTQKTPLSTVGNTENALSTVGNTENELSSVGNAENGIISICSFRNRHFQQSKL